MDVFGITLASFITAGTLGIVFGIILAFSARIFHVEKDERSALVEQSLPGLNCGTCGYLGCAAYAAAVLGGEAALNICLPGGEDVAKKIASVMNAEVEFSKNKMVTQVHCRGGKATSKYAFAYNGVKDCNALHALYGGDKQCKYSCLALGSCIRVCPVDAIDYDAEGLVWVDKDACIGCGKCVDICPTGVMRWIPYGADMIVACHSKDRGPVTRRYCSVGCIACKICEKESPDGGYLVADFLSVIDYTRTGERVKAAGKCPTQCIIANGKAAKG
jgi:Na+-translocating ferredoxin:NAD+ oxidoreductase subunit B